MLVNREKLLASLESVSPGLASREMIEQSACFVFVSDRVCTFNDEIACSIKSPLSGITCAVPAKPFMDLLSKLPEDEVNVVLGDGKIQIKGKGRRAEINVEAEVKLPIDAIEEPGDWVSLDPDFLEGVSIAATVAATTKDANFVLTCVHIHPDHLEACDNFQAVRFPLKTGAAESCLVRQSAIRHIPPLGMSEMSVGESWIHFRNTSGLMMSCRRWQEQYENLDAILDCDGDTITLPGGLSEAVDKARIFSADNVETDQLYIRIKDGALLIRGEGSQGRYEEKRKVSFSGDVSFMISPKLLIEISKRAQDCVLAPGRLKVSTGRFCYVSCLGAVE